MRIDQPHVQRGAFIGLVAGAVLSAGAPASAQTKTGLHVGTIPIDAAMEPYYALKQGFFAAQGLDVSVDALDNPPAVIAAVASGTIDIGYAGSFSLIAAVDHGLPLRAIAPAALSMAGAPVEALIALKQSPYRTGKDLNGKTIAVFDLKGTTQITAAAWVDSGGGASDSIKWIEMPDSLKLAALERGTIDAAAVALSTYPDLGSPASPARILGYPYDTVAKRFIASCWISTTAWIDTHRDVANRFAHSMRDTARWANTHHAESGEILMERTKLTADGLRALAPFRVTQGETLEAALLQPVIAMQAHYGAIAKPFPASDLIGL